MNNHKRYTISNKLIGAASFRARVPAFTDAGRVLFEQSSGLFRAEMPNKETSPAKQQVADNGESCSRVGMKKRGISHKNAVLGIRGGSWNNDSSNLRVSDRNNAGNTNADRNNNYGVRALRTLLGNKRRLSILSRLNLDRSGKREKDEDV